MALPFRKRPGVAVVEIHGVIDNQVRTLVYERLFESIAESQRYRALLLDMIPREARIQARRSCTTVC